MTPGARTRNQRLQKRLALTLGDNLPSPSNNRAAISRSGPLMNLHVTIALSLLVLGANARPISADGLPGTPLATLAGDFSENLLKLLGNTQQAVFSSFSPGTLDEIGLSGNNLLDLKETITKFLSHTSSLVTGGKSEHIGIPSLDDNEQLLQLVSPPRTQLKEGTTEGSVIDPQPIAVDVIREDPHADPPSSPLSEHDSPRIMPGEFPKLDYTPPHGNKPTLMISASASSLFLLFAVAAVQSLRQLRSVNNATPAIDATPELDDPNNASNVQKHTIEMPRGSLESNEKNNGEGHPRRIIPRGASVARKKSKEDLLCADFPALSLPTMSPSNQTAKSLPEVVEPVQDSQVVSTIQVPSAESAATAINLPSAANLNMALLHLPVTMTWMFHFILVFFGWFGFVLRPQARRALVNSF